MFDSQRPEKVSIKWVMSIQRVIDCIIKMLDKNKLKRLNKVERQLFENNHLILFCPWGSRLTFKAYFLLKVRTKFTGQTAKRFTAYCVKPV